MVQTHHALVRRIKSGAGERAGFIRLNLSSGEPRHVADEKLQVLRSALAEACKQRVVIAGRNGGKSSKPLVAFPAFAGKQRKRYAAVARQWGETVATVTPPVITAEDAGEDHPRMDRDAVDPQIH